MPNSATLHRLSRTQGVENDGGNVTIYDIRAYTAERETTLDQDEIWNLMNWYLDGCCPVCGDEINVGEVICDACYENASRYPPRADELFKDHALEEHKRNRRMGTFDSI